MVEGGRWAVHGGGMVVDGRYMVVGGWYMLVDDVGWVIHIKWRWTGGRKG